jgi:hypothetical protein
MIGSTGAGDGRGVGCGVGRLVGRLDGSEVGAGVGGFVPGGSIKNLTPAAFTQFFPNEPTSWKGGKREILHCSYR